MPLQLRAIAHPQALHSIKNIPNDHDDVIKWKQFSALLVICAGNSTVPGEFPHKGRWRGALMFSLICVWINGWVNNGEAGDLRRYRAHYDVTVMIDISLLVLCVFIFCRYQTKHSSDTLIKLHEAYEVYKSHTPKLRWLLAFRSAKNTL